MGRGLKVIDDDTADLVIAAGKVPKDLKLRMINEIDYNKSVMRGPQSIGKLIEVAVAEYLDKTRQDY